MTTVDRPGAGTAGHGSHGTGEGEHDSRGHAAHGGNIFDPHLLDRCISCGFCLPACPTYALTKDEGSSPRGRITLMRALETGKLDPDDARLREESSFCLGCRACEPVCPAGAVRVRAGRRTSPISRTSGLRSTTSMSARASSGRCRPRHWWSRQVSNRCPYCTPAGQTGSHARQPRQNDDSSCSRSSSGSSFPVSSARISVIRPRGEEPSSFDRA